MRKTPRAGLVCEWPRYRPLRLRFITLGTEGQRLPHRHQSSLDVDNGKTHKFAQLGQGSGNLRQLDTVHPFLLSVNAEIQCPCQVSKKIGCIIALSPSKADRKAVRHRPTVHTAPQEG